MKELQKILQKNNFTLYKKINSKVFLFKKKETFLNINLELKTIEFSSPIYLNFECIKAIYDFMLKEFLK